MAQKNYDPVLPPMPDDVDDEEDSVKIIRLVKNREPLVSLVNMWYPNISRYLNKARSDGGIPYILLFQVHFLCVLKLNFK